ncbi:hypothetical protein FQN57_002215 [Myotisia sp. PD_48]|nr:hypothetical protein FQN57_002215 [Myotisia sp. PD_48]
MDFFSIFRSIAFSSTPPPLFHSTRSASLLNPLKHSISEDTCIARLPGHTPIIPTVSGAKTLSELTDEELLARFTRGFFGGYVFTPERLLLRTISWKFFGVQIKNHNYDTSILAPFDQDQGQKHAEPATEQPPKNIWRPSEFSLASILPLKSKIYGAFQVTDTYLVDKKLHDKNSLEPNVNRNNYSYIDFGFGNRTSSFAGCHRFSIHRHADAARNTTEAEGMPQERKLENRLDSMIEFRLSGFQCNPVENSPSLAVSYLERFHRIYARLLFTDSIRATFRPF